MNSTFTWLDYSEHERRKMLDVVKLFGERDTRDELGIGSVRDAFADLFFPGTSTIQTRARYFFFIPWMYLDLEQRRTEPGKIAERARKQETALIKFLLATGETGNGVIGQQAQEKLQRLPSNIYWQGLGVLGIRLFSGSQDQYHRSLAGYYAHISQVKHQRIEEASDLRSRANWHAGLPPAPSDFPNQAVLALTRPEAEYLRERIQTQARDTLMAFWAGSRTTPPLTSFPWEAVHDHLPKELRQKLEHAQNFSEAIHGAALLYNLLLAEQFPNPELIDTYRKDLKEWAGSMNDRMSSFSRWDKTQFWLIVHGVNPRVPFSTRMFIDQWLELTLNPKKLPNIAEDSFSRDLIRTRERFLKRGQARLENRRALDLWTGAAGTGQLDFRWRIAWRHLQDIHEGLRLR